MKIAITTLSFLFLVISASAFADSGTTYCPRPQDFHYDQSSYTLVGPADWSIIANVPSGAKVDTFIGVSASRRGSLILDCSYTISFKGETATVQASTSNRLKADNINDPVWKDRMFDKWCAETDPQQCRFHID